MEVRIKRMFFFIGIVTGSIYMDYGLRMHGFPAENVTDGSVLVVKTHEAPPRDPNKFKSAILLIRNPRDAILVNIYIIRIFKNDNLSMFRSMSCSGIMLTKQGGCVFRSI